MSKYLEEPGGLKNSPGLVQLHELFFFITRLLMFFLQVSSTISLVLVAATFFLLSSVLLSFVENDTQPVKISGLFSLDLEKMWCFLRVALFFARAGRGKAKISESLSRPGCSLEEGMSVFSLGFLSLDESRIMGLYLSIARLPRRTAVMEEEEEPASISSKPGQEI